MKHVEIARFAAEHLVKAREILEGASGAIDEKKRRRLVLRAWSYVQGTNAWNHGEEAYAMLDENEDLDTFTCWCWYTAEALAFCDVVRETAARWSVELPRSS